MIVAPRMQARFGSLKVLGGSLVLLAADVLVLGYGTHTAAVVCMIGRLHRREQHRLHRAGPRRVGRTAPGGERRLQLRPVVRRRGRALLRAEIEEWSDIHIPFVVAAITAVIGAVVVFVRRNALSHEAEELQP